MRDFSEDIGLEFKGNNLTVKYIIISKYLNGLSQKNPSTIRILWKSISNCIELAPVLYYHIREFLVVTPDVTLGCLYFKRRPEDKEDICVFRHYPYTYIPNKPC